MALLKLGTQAPDFSLPNHTGQPLSLTALRGTPVVLFFYPKDNTAICTRQACHFRDAYEEFTQAGAVVIGVSSDSDTSHQNFAARHSLPFHLLSDSDGSLRQAYKVPNTLGLMPGRVTYLIDGEGHIRLAFSAQFSAAQHVEEALETLKKLS